MSKLGETPGELGGLEGTAEALEEGHMLGDEDVSISLSSIEGASNTSARPVKEKQNPLPSPTSRFEDGAVESPICSTKLGH
ncbi:hypothetical protein OC845_005625 [Tilletia horrida]|nr:hypothetical protein OC845_005625 [Tilletia horrida]